MGSKQEHGMKVQDAGLSFQLSSLLSVKELG
jgi:hypothetical protein